MLLCLEITGKTDKWANERISKDLTHGSEVLQTSENGSFWRLLGLNGFFCGGTDLTFDGYTAASP